jgi:serine/threonine protein kinase/tetratricopeptide (TPR) repeat protein
LSLTAGLRLGPYEILGPLGAGGMGEVYKARDTRLERTVAVKVLPAATSQDPEALARFEREWRAVAALSHPNILAIHDVGRQGETSFAVLELLEGETLRERLLARGALPVRDALEVGAAIADGLAAAHARSLVHRDVKPENVFLTADGRVKILDFGIGRAAHHPMAERNLTAIPTEGWTLTQPGTILGTASYMSPEQARGEEVDGRSDVFALGCVLYEMLTGARAFGGASATETLASILRDEPAAPGERGARVPAEVDGIVRRCLRKNRLERFQSASDLAYALRGARSSAAAPAARASETTRRSLAVLLFKDLAEDPANAHLGLGLADATITELAARKSLIVRPTASILRYRDRSIPPEQAGRELGVDAVVDGSFQRAGSRLRVTVQLLDSADGRPLWGTKVDASIDDLFAMQDHVSREIAEALRIELGSPEPRPGRIAPASGPAYEHYLRGRLELSADTTLPKILSAIECFEKALEAAPDFALARLGLADAYARMDFSIDPEGGWFDRAEAMCEQALAAAPDLPEGRYLRGRLLWHPRNGWDSAGAMREFAAATAGRPGLNEAHHFLGQLLNHVGLLDEALECFDRALAIEPDDQYARTHIALTFTLQGRFAEALAATEAASASLSSSWGLYQMALCQLHLGRGGDAATTIESLSRQFPGNVLLFSLRALMAALAGDARRAREQIELVVRNRKLFGHYHHAQYDAACAEALLGGEAAAVDWLTEAAGNGFPCAPVFQTDPWLARVRGDSRFQHLSAEVLGIRETHLRLYRELQAANP